MYSPDELNQIAADNHDEDDMNDPIPAPVAARVYYAVHRDVLFDVPSNYEIATAAAKGHYRAVATLNARYAEEVYTRLQNDTGFGGYGKRPIRWSEAETFIGDPRFDRRSMSVGDIIVWADRRVEIVDSFGFKELPTLIGARLRIGEGA